MPSRLLVLSNGHGEDQIALRVIRALQERRPELEIAVLPLVGEGSCFAEAARTGAVHRIGPRQSLPSGGFSNQSARGLAHDLAAGLPLLSWNQFQVVRCWGRSGQPVLAVGDLLPLLLAWASGAPYGFVGTPKSDYTWRSGPGRNCPADLYHRLKGSEWDPWEWALMRQSRCRLVAVRDALTARGLRRHGVRVQAPGNPMMDGLPLIPLPPSLRDRRRVLLLCGSRMPEARTNFNRLLAALELLPAGESMAVLCATGSRPTPSQLEAVLRNHRYSPAIVPPGCGGAAAWQRGHRLLVFGSGSFQRWAGWGEVGLATAGTATEQLVGLGIPALSLPGPGPQFKASFARRQSRMLGGAVRVCATPEELAQELCQLLGDPGRRLALGRIGRRRMGAPGASARLAALLERDLLGAAPGRGRP